MTRFAHAGLFPQILQVPSSPSNSDAWIEEARHLATRKAEVHLTAHANFDYVKEYYDLFYQTDSDVWAESRFGSRAKASNDMIMATVPKHMRMMMGFLESGEEGGGDGKVYEYRRFQYREGFTRDRVRRTLYSPCSRHYTIYVKKHPFLM